MGYANKRGKANGPCRRVIRAFAVALFVFLCVPLTVLAADTPPDDLSIESVIVTRNLATTGDYLFTAHYDIEWDAGAASYPEDNANLNFLVQLIDSGTVMATVAPYVFYNAGYGEGVVSFYFSGTDAATLAWDTAYTVRITSQPGWLDPVVSYDYTLGASDYCSDTDQDDNQDWLADWVIDTADSIENSWDITDTLTTVSVDDVLTETGEAYYGRVIPGLRYLCPQLYVAAMENSDWTDENYSRAQEQAFETQWDDTDTWVEDSLSGIGELFGSPFILLNFICIGGVLALMVVSFAMFQEARPGLLLGLLILVISANLGFFEIAALAFIAFLFVLYIGHSVFIKRAA